MHFRIQINYSILTPCKINISLRVTIHQSEAGQYNRVRILKCLFKLKKIILND